MTDPKIDEPTKPGSEDEQAIVLEQEVKRTEKRATVVMGPPITNGEETDEDEDAEDEDGEGEEVDILADLPDDTEVCRSEYRYGKSL